MGNEQSRISDSRKRKAEKSLKSSSRKKQCAVSSAQSSDEHDMIWFKREDPLYTHHARVPCETSFSNLRLKKLMLVKLLKTAPKERDECCCICFEKKKEFCIPLKRERKSSYFYQSCAHPALLCQDCMRRTIDTNLSSRYPKRLACPLCNEEFSCMGIAEANNATKTPEVKRISLHAYGKQSSISSLIKFASAHVQLVYSESEYLQMTSRDKKRWNLSIFYVAFLCLELELSKSTNKGAPFGSDVVLMKRMELKEKINEIETYASSNPNSLSEDMFLTCQYMESITNRVREERKKINQCYFLSFEFMFPCVWGTVLRLENRYEFLYNLRKVD